MSGNRRLLMAVAGIVAVVAAFLIAHSGSSNSAPEHHGQQGDPRQQCEAGGRRSEAHREEGRPRDFTVKSDTADEIHVHGYDFHKDVDRRAAA